MRRVFLGAVLGAVACGQTWCLSSYYWKDCGFKVQMQKLCQSFWLQIEVSAVPTTTIVVALYFVNIPHSIYFLYARTQSKFQALICNRYLALSIIICEQYHLNVTNMISQYLKALSCDDNSMLCAWQDTRYEWIVKVWSSFMSNCLL